MDKVERILELENELCALRYDLKYNQAEQERLHDIECSLKRRIQLKEEELRQLESARESNND